MRSWNDNIDPATIPTAVLTSEWARRRSAQRKTFGTGTGRPVKLVTCKNCGAQTGTAAMRQHKCLKGEN